MDLTVVSPNLYSLPLLSAASSVFWPHRKDKESLSKHEARFEEASQGRTWRF